MGTGVLSVSGSSILQGLQDEGGVEHDQAKNENEDAKELETELESVEQTLEVGITSVRGTER